MQTRFHTIDGETLMNQPLQPMQFTVEGLLSNGLHLLAGAPKSGKSWLALWLSVTVARGEPIWGNTSRQGTTLYLCFEDSRLISVAHISDDSAVSDDKSDSGLGVQNIDPVDPVGTG